MDCLICFYEGKIVDFHKLISQMTGANIVHLGLKFWCKVLPCCCFVSVVPQYFAKHFKLQFFIDFFLVCCETELKISLPKFLDETSKQGSI